MDHQTVTEIRKHIDPQEKILWAGKPRQGVVFRDSDSFSVPFSLLWTGGTFFAIYLFTITGETSLAFVLVSIVFMVAGIYMVAGRFIVDTRKREEISYAVTPERILIVSGGASQSVSLGTLREISIVESGNGTGSIFFGPFFPVDSLTGDIYAEYGTKWPCFHTIDNPKKIYQVIRKAQKNACGIAFGLAAAEAVAFQGRC